MPEGGRLVLLTMLGGCLQATLKTTLEGTSADARTGAAAADSAAASIRVGAATVGRMLPHSSSGASGVIEDLLKSIAATLVAPGAPVEESSIFSHSSILLKAIFVQGDTTSSGSGLTKPDVTTSSRSGLTKPDEPAISGLALLLFGLSLLPWRHFGLRVLQPLLATCDTLASSQPQSVLATLFALVIHSHASAGLSLKFGAPAGPCALALCLVLETALAPIAARVGDPTLSATERQRQAWAASAHHGAIAHHGASAHHGVRQAWAALKVLAATRSPQLGVLLPRILTAVRALLATPADALDALECCAEAEGGAHDGAGSPAGVLLHAAALEALTSLTATAEGSLWSTAASTAASEEVPSDAAVGAKRSRADAAAAVPAAAAAAAAATASKKKKKKGALEAAPETAAESAAALPNLGMGDIEAALRCLLYPPALETARHGSWSHLSSCSHPALLRACTSLIDLIDSRALGDSHVAVSGAVTGAVVGAGRPSEELLIAVLPRLHGALSDASPETRARALDLLSALHRRGWLLPLSELREMAPDVDLALVERVLELGRQIEASPLSPTSKQLAMDAEQLIKLARTPTLPPSAARVLVSHSFGMLRIRYARVWPHVRELLQALMKQWGGILTEPLLGTLRGAIEGATSGHTDSAVLGTRGGRATRDRGGDGDEAEEDGRVVEGAHEGAPETALEGGDHDDAAAERAAPSTALVSAVDQAWEKALEPSPQGTEEAHLATQLLEALLGASLLPLVTKHAELLVPLWRAVAQDGALAQDGVIAQDGALSTCPRAGSEAAASTSTTTTVLAVVMGAAVGAAVGAVVGAVAGARLDTRSHLASGCVQDARPRALQVEAIGTPQAARETLADETLVRFEVEEVQSAVALTTALGAGGPRRRRRRRCRSGGAGGRGGGVGGSARYSAHGQARYR